MREIFDRDAMRPLAGTITNAIVCTILWCSAGDVFAAQESKVIATEIAQALKGKDDALRAAAKHLGDAVSAVSTRAEVESLARLSPRLLRALLDAASPADAKNLAERILAAREKYAAPADALAADLVNAIGEADFEAGDIKKALAEFELSLKYRQIAYGDRHPLLAESLNNIAVAQQNLGEYHSARVNFERSLTIRAATLPRQHKDIIESINNLGMLNFMTGQYALAVGQFKRVIETRRTRPGPGSLEYADALNNLAELYREIGAADKALPMQESALAIRRKRLGSQHALVAESLSNIGSVHAIRGDLPSAERAYREAIDIGVAASGPEHTTVGAMKNNLGVVLLRAGSPAAAEPLLASVLALRRKTLGENHPRTARSHDNLSQVYLAKRDLDKARLSITQALAIAEAGDDPDSRWRILYSACKIERASANPGAAILFGKRAVNVLQSLRGDIALLESSLRQSFVRDKGEVYRTLIDLMVDASRIPEAQQVLRMLKEDEYFDFIKRGGKDDPRVSRIELTATESESLVKYEGASRGAARAANELAQLRGRKVRSASEEERIEALSTEVNNTRAAFNAALTEIQLHFSGAGVRARRAQEIGEMNLTRLRSLQGTLQELGAGVVIIHYVVLDKKLQILLTTPTVQIARETVIDVDELNRRVVQFREGLQTPRKSPVKIARLMYETLIAPIAMDLELAGARTIMLSLDGALRYVPFAALHDGANYLVEKYQWALFAEAARDKIKDKAQPNWRVAALGMTQSAEGFSALPSVAEELRGIVRTRQNPQGILPGRVALDQAFSRKALVAALEEGFPVLHLASHFVLKPGAEHDSFLLLGDRTRLSLREMKDDEFDFRKVDLITLSACDTAVAAGRDQMGLEIEGFAAQVQNQGARSVLATLWQVDDQSTAELMRRFYALRGAAGFNKVDALRSAQLTLLTGVTSKLESSGKTRSQIRGVNNLPSGKDLRFQHPYYWAPFVIAGNWS